MAFTDVEGFLRDPEAHISLREWAAQKIVPPSIRDVEAFLRDATIDESIRKAVAARTRIEKPAEILPLLDDERVSGQIRTTLIRTLFASANKIEFAEIAPLFRISEVAKLFSRMLVF